MGLIADERIREGYDRQWGMYPYEHPSFYWLRSDARVIICTRCSARFTPALGEDPESGAEGFSAKHASCALGKGFERIKLADHVPPPPTPDPIFG